MYESYFQLESRPFTAAPFIDNYYAANAIGNALSQSQLAIDRGSGPVVVLGGSGTGKTLLLMMLAEKYSSTFKVINLGCARLAERADLLQSILFEVSRPYTGMTEGELRLSLMDYLKQDADCPSGVLLLVDEAHQLDAGLLDEVCLLTNMVRDGQPRVRLVMAGKHQLEDSLTNPKLDSFNQRIAARGYLTNLSCEETADYIQNHVDRVGGIGREIFPELTSRVIFEVTDGCPRLVNQLCEQALTLAAAKDHQMVTEQCAQEAWRDVQNIPGAMMLVSESQNSEIDQDENWTVLEFGPLDDESATDELDDLEVPVQPETQHQDQFEQDSEQQFGEVTQEFETSSLNSDAETELVETCEQSTEDDLQNEQLLNENYGEIEHDSVFDEEDLVDDIARPLDAFDIQDSTEDLEDSGLTPAFSASVLDEPSNFVSHEATDGSIESYDSMEQPVDASFEHPGFDNHPDGALLDSVQECDSTEEESVCQVEDDQFTEQDAFADEFANAEAGVETEEEPSSAPVAEEMHQTPRLIPGLESPSQALDPFAEEYEEEEFLADKYMPFVAEQNRMSLTVTPSDLESLRPPQKNISFAELHADLLGQSDDEATESFIESDEADSIPGRDSVATVRMSEDTVSYEDWEADTDEANENGHTENAESVSHESQLGFEAESSSVGQPETFGVVSENFANSETSEEIHELPTARVEQSESAIDQPSLAEYTSPEESVEERIYAPSLSDNDHDHEDQIDDEYVRRRSEEILNDLSAMELDGSNASDEVSGSNDLGNSEVTQGTNPFIKSFGSSEDTSDPGGVVSFEDAVNEKESTDTDFQASVEPYSKDSDGDNTETGQMAIEYPVVEHENYQQGGDENHRDDRDMIIVSRAEQLPSQDQDDDIPAHLMPESPSKGRASRMEYQQLFDQLRDLPQNQ